MFDYFRGGKRKAGLVSLVIACAFMGLWFRSGLIEDRIGRNLRSCNGQIAFYEDSTGMADYDFQNVITAADGGSAAVQQTPTAFTATVESMFGPKIRWRVPYWPIAISLTLFSAWLLLSKHRQPAKLEPFRGSAA